MENQEKLHNALETFEYGSDNEEAKENSDEDSLIDVKLEDLHENVEVKQEISDLQQNAILSEIKDMSQQDFDSLPNDKGELEFMELADAASFGKSLLITFLCARNLQFFNFQIFLFLTFLKFPKKAERSQRRMKMFLKVPLKPRIKRRISSCAMNVEVSLNQNQSGSILTEPTLTNAITFVIYVDTSHIIDTKSGIISQSIPPRNTVIMF